MMAEAALDHLTTFTIKLTESAGPGAQNSNKCSDYAGARDPLLAGKVNNSKVCHGRSRGVRVEDREPAERSNREETECHTQHHRAGPCSRPPAPRRSPPPFPCPSASVPPPRPSWSTGAPTPPPTVR